MKHRKHLAGKLVLCSALLGCPTYAQPAVSVGVSVPLPSVEVVLPSVEIRAESDFYEPLTPEGEWVVIGNYGRCFRPGHVDRDWRPYCNGSWQRTDAGWYWASDEPWAWATYHYGRWDFTDQYGWYWVPQTQWAPAWVSWHEGGGYIGWSPLHPSARISVSGAVELNVAMMSPRGFVFVEERSFLEPVRPTTVVLNNTTIINKTVNITNIRVANNTVINEGPRTTVIEQVSGKTVQAVPVHELRRTQEAPVVARQRAAAPVIDNKAQPPIGTPGAPIQTKAVPTHDPLPLAKPAAITHGPTPLEKPAVTAHLPTSLEKPTVIPHAPTSLEKPVLIPHVPTPAAPEKQLVERVPVHPVPNPVEATPRVRPGVKPVVPHPTTPASEKALEKKLEEAQTPPEKPALPR